MPTISPIGTASLALQAAGLAASTVGSYYSARFQKNQLAFDASMADINARISELGAQSALDQGQRQVGALTMQAGNLKSRQRAALAANGVDLGEGNAAEIQASTAIMSEMDKNTLEANAVRTAWGYRTQGTNYQNQAVMDRGAAGGISPFSAGVVSLLTGGGQVAASWYQLDKASR
ncbi:MAG: hypothetical protein HZY77_01510 [Thiobacillus sp.]|uniref:virion core protein, T7 gp14 family n=1 Tax=Thiobacillus sp. TaxID=924 RepID=UPI00168C51B5|nr:hypothetical protein [Thiobacillus sp.]QLQ01741.1 MAG: hypothetical protein HZY77_01510 [Thiobacillus sp.]